jgi:hypothetical protein
MLHEAGDPSGRKTERELVKDEVLDLFDKYTADLKSGRRLESFHIRTAVSHLEQLRKQIDDVI